MAHAILGLHHVTATVDQAQPDLDFCLDLLGLRLVKKTVNFDNHSVFHFYYGNETGAPGTIWTTFPYHGMGVRAGAKGAGQVVTTSFSVPAASLDLWIDRLQQAHVPVGDDAERFGERVIRFPDPSGLVFELIGSDRDSRVAWTGGTRGADSAIRGLHSVTMTVRSPERTFALMTEVLGYRIVGTSGARTRLAAGADAPGHLIDVVADPQAPAAVNGIGTVHHVAMAIGTDEEQVRLRDDLWNRGVQVTDVRDRCYFHSIYFREPGGVLFEVATVQPGFTIDEPLIDLGRGLKLPPWEEPHRPTIEATLPRIAY
jgi:glyoxalase family protein